MSAPTSRSTIVDRSSNWSHDSRDRHTVLVASIDSAGHRSPPVASAREMTAAQQKSIGMSQSNRQNGSEIIRAAR